MLRPLLHRERPGGPPGAGGRAVQHGECTWRSRSLASHWAEFLVLSVNVALMAKPVPLREDICRGVQDKGWPG